MPNLFESLNFINQATFALCHYEDCLNHLSLQINLHSFLYLDFRLCFENIYTISEYISEDSEEFSSILSTCPSGQFRGMTSVQSIIKSSQLNKIETRNLHNIQKSTQSENLIEQFLVKCTFCTDVCKLRVESGSILKHQVCKYLS